MNYSEDALNVAKQKEKTLLIYLITDSHGGSLQNFLQTVKNIVETEGHGCSTNQFWTSEVISSEHTLA